MKTVRFYPFVFTGERRLKLTGESNRLDVCQRLRTPQNKLNEVSNADFMTTGTLLNTPTLYPSAYLVLTSKGYTKHYYAGADLCASREQSQACLSYAETKQSVRSNRVAASLGGGRLNAVGSNPGMQERADWLFWESHERVNGRMLQENDHECIWQSSLFTQEYYESIKDIPGRMNASVEFKLDDFHKNLEMLADEQHDEKDVYFYHSDHLGSASWITDGSGIPVQHLQYLPFGEPFVDQHPAGYQERFRFTGKERDEETGYGYFGARYMDHELTAMWLSVDPMADKYPSISPYAYCAWNPIKLVDPDGMEINPVYTINGDYLGNTIEGFTGDPLIMNKNDYETMMGVSEATNISELSVDDVRTYGGTTFDDVVKRGSALSGDAQEKIIKNIISQYRDPQISFFFNVGFNGSDVAKKMKYDVDNTELKGKYNFGTNSSSIYFKHNNWNYEFTVENITASVVYHEWLGHDKMEWGNGIEMAEKKASDGGTHYACYLSVMTSPIWQKTTKS